MNPLPYLRRARDEARQALAPLVDLLPDAVREIARDAAPFVALWIAWFVLVVLVLSATLPGCTTTSPSNGLVPAIQFSRDQWCERDHDVRVVIDSMEYRLEDTEERRRIPVAAGNHVITHYVGSYQMRRWTVEVRGLVYVKLQCRGQTPRKPAYPEMKR